MIIQGPEIYYAASCLILVVTSLFCALVRYFHMCRPFDEEETYFYPARKLITIVYACFALPVVWLFRMDSPDAYFFMRVFLMLLLPGAGVLSFRRFFFSKTRHRREIPSTAIVICFFSLSEDIPCCLQPCCCIPQAGCCARFAYTCRKNIPTVKIFRYVLPVLSYSCRCCIWEPHGGCFLQATIIITCGSSWSSEELIAEKIETVLSDRGSGSSLLSVDAKDELEAKIRAALTEDRLYLNPNLKIGELADAVKSNRKYVSIVMKERFGSFYKELNRLRIEAAVRYREEHPSASREEIATHCYTLRFFQCKDLQPKPEIRDAGQEHRRTI